jgi:hypothetical protein
MSRPPYGWNERREAMRGRIDRFRARLPLRRDARIERAVQARKRAPVGRTGLLSAERRDRILGALAGLVVVGGVGSAMLLGGRVSSAALEAAVQIPTFTPRSVTLASPMTRADTSQSLVIDRRSRGNLFALSTVDRIVRHAGAGGTQVSPNGTHAHSPSPSHSPSPLPSPPPSPPPSPSPSPAPSPTESPSPSPAPSPTESTHPTRSPHPTGSPSPPGADDDQ